MPQRLESISRFSPGNCAPELLESMLVGRGELVDRFERAVVDSIKTGAGHHWLLIGPRGAGKTHVLAILHNRIACNQDVRPRVAIAYLKEEERGVASFLDWLVRILRSLHRWEEKPPPGETLDLGEELEGLTKLPLDSARAMAERLLVRFVGKRRLLLIAENLGEIFDEVKGMGRKGQQRFRDLVQQHPFWTIAASSQALFEDVQAREAPFYGFFKVSHLGMFDLEESVTLLKKLADLEGRTEFRESLDSEVGRGRIRVIHQLTGGNPRLLVIFYQFVDRESMDDLATPFLEMVDSLTSYYQEQMQPLPALQQKIVEFLCEQRAPATVKGIAQSCFITHQTASKQLSRLTERRYVVATTVGRQSFYELREPLFRICFEVKENLGYPIRLFVDFLGTFYSIEELKRKYRSATLLRSIYQSGGLLPQTRKVEVELDYLSEALSAYHAEGWEDLTLEAGTVAGPELEIIGKTVEELFSARDYREAVKLAEAAYDVKLGDSELGLWSAAGHLKLGDLKGARDWLDRLVRSEPSDLEVWILKAEIEKAEGESAAAEECYARVLAIDRENVHALMGLGIILGNRGEDAEALQLFSRATKAAVFDPNAWLNLGIAQGITGDINAARSSYEKATELAPDSVEAWEYRGWFLGAQAEYDIALKCFERVTELCPEYGEGWRLLGAAQQNNGEIDAAQESYDKATELAPHSATVWESRGRCLGTAGKYEAALKCFERVTELRPDYGEGWRLLAVAQQYAGKTEAAWKSYAELTRLVPDSSDAWEDRGRFVLTQGEHKAALQCFKRVTALRPDYGEGWRLLGVAQEHTGEIEAASKSYEEATKMAPDSAVAWEYRGRLLGVLGEHVVALRCFERVSGLRPDYAEGWRLLGVAQENTGEIEGSRNCYEKITELVPESSAAWEDLGRFLWRQGERSAATQCFAHVIKLRPDYGEGWWLLGIAQKDNGEIDAARRSYRKATELAPDNANAWMSRGLFLSAQSEPNSALRCFEHVTELSPNYAEGWFLLGLAHGASGNLGLADESLQQSTELDPQNVLAWAFRAQIAARCQEPKKGREYLRKAETLSEDSHLELNIALGDAYRLLGQYDEAIQRYRKALNLDPGNCSAAFNIALAYFEAGDFGAGAKQIEIAASAGVGQDWSSSLPLSVAGINEHLLRSVEPDQLPDLLTRQIRIFEASPLRDHFIQGLTGALMEVLKKHAELPADRLPAVRDRAIPALSGIEELSVACRLFATGVDYLETRDVKVLLTLPREERQSLEEVLNSTD